MHIQFNSIQFILHFQQNIQSNSKQIIIVKNINRGGLKYDSDWIPTDVFRCFSCSNWILCDLVDTCKSVKLSDFTVVKK